MKKIKFLSFAALAACFAMSLTSCEKEDFTTDVEAPEVNVPTITIPGVTIPEGYKPGDAVVAIQPTVIGFISVAEGWDDAEGAAQNITEDCKITYNGADKFTYTTNADGSINAMTVKIVAEYTLEVNGFSNTYSVEHTVEIPALSAGMVAVITPTLIINAGAEISNPYTITPYEEIKDETVNGQVELVNTNPYYYTDYTAVYTYEIGYGDVEADIIDSYKDNETLINYINNITRWNGLSDYSVDITVPYLYAESSTIIPYTQRVVTYQNVYAVDAEFSRATETVATVTWKSYEWRIFDTENCTYTESTTGHGSHYKGHGHGGSNAGGGISWAE